MIELHRLAEDDLSNRIEEKLDELVVAFRKVQHETASGSGLPLPHIRENEEIISGEESLKQYLYRLEDELRYQRSLSGDGCYIDPETGDVC